MQTWTDIPRKIHTFSALLCKWDKKGSFDQVTKITKQILNDTLCKLKYEALNAGLIVNNNKTKYLHCIRKTIQPTYINTAEKQFEQVNSFKYLGTMVNTDSSIEEEIKERIAAGNRTFHVHKNLFTSKLISRNIKLQLYNTLIRPTGIYDK